MGDFEGVIWLARANEVEVKVEIKSRDTRQLAGSRREERVRSSS